MGLQGFWVCDACKSLNDPRHSACYKCHVKRGEARPQPIIPGATVGPALSETYGRGARDTRGGPSLMAAGLIGGSMALLLTVLWFWAEAGIRFGQGRIAWFVGFLIAVTVLLAGTLGGRRRVSFMLPVISFLLTLGAIVAGEYLIISEALANGAGFMDTGSLVLATPDQIGAVFGDYVTTDPLRPILWVLGLAASWLIPWGVLVGNLAER